MTDTTQPEKMPLTSLDIAAEKREQIRRVIAATFPEVMTQEKIDLDQLKRVLGEWVEPDRERFGLTWPGKAACMKVIQAPSVGTLKPCPEDSVDWDTTENVFIEGDNLEVLKLLQKAYFGKIKMIYIDPPYNTGKEFIYPDKYAETLETYLEYTGQKDSEGRKFSTNTDSSGRFHSRWLNMMYPRLYLAKNLLRDDGVIFVSIDDAEVDNLRKCCVEVFGEENFVASLVWEKSRKNDAKLFSVGHEYILVYAKSLESLKQAKTLWREEKPGAKEIWDEYMKLRKNHDSDDKAIERDLKIWYQALPKGDPSKKWARYSRIDANGPWRDRDISWPGGDGPRYDVIHPITGLPCKVPEAGWRYANSDEMQRQIRLGSVEFRADHTEPPFRKAHLRPVAEELDDESPDDDDVEGSEEAEDEELATQVRGTYFYKQSQVAVKYLRKLLGAKLFDNPKDHEELSKLFRYVSGQSENDIFLDFFAGSGTTAEAVFRANVARGTHHKFILVQLPEPCNPKNRSGKAAIAKGLRTVADVARYRIKRAAEAVRSDCPEFQGDLGFRSFRLGASSFEAWDGDVDKVADSDLLARMEHHANHLAATAKPSEILFELLLKDGFAVTVTVEERDLAGSTVFSVADGALLICLDRNLTPEVIDAMAALEPSRVICLDAGFQGNDQLKANAVQTFKARARNRETAIEFRTV